MLSPRGVIGNIAVVIVVWTHFLDKSVVYAIEGYVDTDDLEWLGANPGDLALRVIEKAGLGRVIGAEGGLLCLVHFLIFHPAVEDLGFFCLNEDLLLKVKLHCFVGWH